MNDETLRTAYTTLRGRRAAEAPPDIDIEIIRSLAEGTYDRNDRDALLDRVLAHPATAREFAFLAEIARARPKARTLHWLAAAASVALVVTAGLFVRQAIRPATDVMRSSGSVPQLVSPPAEETVAAGSRFVWNRYANANAYRFEMIDAEGDLVTQASTLDTAWVLPVATTIETGASYVWWVTAVLEDGTERRARPRRVTGG